LAYGQSNDIANPHFANQASLFTDNKVKKVAFTEKKINKTLKNNISRKKKSKS
jgi:hypothetical protein